MDEFQRIWKRHQYVARASTAFIYGILVSIAMNFFWTPGKIYSSGVTGLAQLIETLTRQYGPIHLSTAALLLLLNLPLFIIAWKNIGHRFTFFTFLAVICSSIMIKSLKPITLTTDPIICAIFGAAINGFGTGLALKNGISTGGLDIIGLTLRKKTGKSIGTINMTFNAFIVLAAGAVYGWPYAFYSALGIVINARVMDMVYTRQQKMQVMIVTNKPKSVVDCIQSHMRRGITIVHGAEGAYRHDEKSILFTVISRYEQAELKAAMEESDPYAFVSISENVQIMGHFYEPEP
ncbi:MAG: YitT family protein [Liquorilactobacillus hordei]|uniref:YitT family protein n=1 Tax=Liquorilactobacillus hordei TaxID=468911 RepID=UPI0039ED07D4